MRHIGYTLEGLKWMGLVAVVIVAVLFSLANARPVLITASILACAWALGLLIDAERREQAEYDEMKREFAWGLPPPPPEE